MDNLAASLKDVRDVKSSEGRSSRNDSGGSGPGRFFADNSLSIAFWALFLLCLVGEGVCGHWLRRSTPHAGGMFHELLAYMGGAEFLKGVFGNWQAALLQLASLIIFAVFLRQRGASHSRKPRAKQGEEQRRFKLIRRGRSWLYRNSLSLGFMLAFLGSFIAFLFADHAASGATHASVWRYLWSARFWFDVLQTWQAEFFAMGLFLVLSIFLRQENSAESKPVWAPDDSTGDTNK